MELRRAVRRPPSVPAEATASVGRSAPYRPSKMGARLSAKAWKASRASSLPLLTDWARASASSAWSSDISRLLLSNCFDIDRARGGPAARRAAQSATSPSSWSQERSG